jgi:hypothetical protein
MHGLHLWNFLTGELPCPSSPSAPAQPVISEKTTAAEKEQFLADYEDRMASYESQFHAYKTWLDEDAHAGSDLTASMEDRFAADIMDFERTHQMWSFLRQKYESTGQSTYLAAIRQEQLLRQGDTTVDDFFDQLSVVWRQLDTLGPQLSPATCQPCRDQTAALELRRTYDFLSRLRDEFESLRAQLLARHPYVSLMDALAEVRNEEVRLRNVGLLHLLLSWLLALRLVVLRLLVLLLRCHLPHLRLFLLLLVVRVVVFIVLTVVTMDMWRRSAIGRRKPRLVVLHRVLVVLVLEDLRGVLLVQRHRRFSVLVVLLVIR